MTFRLGKPKIGAKQSRQSNSKCNFVQCVFKRKEYKQCTLYNGVWDKAPNAGEFSEIFVLKVP